jgi:hypothetical protein
MSKGVTAVALFLSLLGGMAAPAAACGTVHLPGCGQSGYYC